MLIDSYPLQAAVIASDIPVEMLGSLDAAGVTGLAVLADGLRKPMAVDHFLVAPADYDGITFTAYPSATMAAAIAALGAEPGVAFAGSRTQGLQDGSIQGFEMNLGGYQIVNIGYLAPYVTGNVNLWANPTALIANPGALADLTEEERGWVTAAAEAAAQQSTVGDADDARVVGELCAAGTRFAVASAADLSAMREAFAPVNATLAEDPETNGYINRITELKSATAPGPGLDIPADCTGTPSSAVSSPAPSTVEPDGSNGSNGSAASESGEATAVSTDDLAGTYRWTITVDDARQFGTPSDQTPSGLAQYPAVVTVVLDDDTWTMPGECERCAYHVDGENLVFDWDGVDLTFAFAVGDDGSLQLRPAAPMNAGMCSSGRPSRGNASPDVTSPRRRAGARRRGASRCPCRCAACRQGLPPGR